MPTALIADDEPHLALHLRQLLQQHWPELEVVALARNGLDAAREIAERRPDLAFLDIRMPGLSGLEVAQGIEGATRVVFVTAYDEFAVQAFEQEAVDYVLKPVRADRLQKTIERVQRALQAPVTDDPSIAALLTRLAAPAATAASRLRWVRASQGELTHQVDVDEVLFFQADEKYTVVRTAAAEHLIRTPISELVQQLDPAQFWQVHRSTVINLRHVAGTRRDELSRLFVRLRGHAAELPVSRAYVHLFKAM
jgi:DNA-binding LytR/AlgR family response regulator